MTQLFTRKKRDYVAEEELVSLVDGRRTPVDAPENNGPIQLTLSITGMHCSSCSSAIEIALKSLPGVSSATVALLSESADVRYNPSFTNEIHIIEAIESSGFEARVVSSTHVDDAHAELITLEITGMHCAACSSAVEAALNSVPGVQKAVVSLSLHQAEVAYKPPAVEKHLIKAVESSGFDARVLNKAASCVAVFQVSGMTCSACSSAVEAALRNHVGVVDASVNPLSGKAEVQFDPGTTGPRHLLVAIEDAGFEAEAITNNKFELSDRNKKETLEYRKQTIIAASFTLPVFLISMVFLPLHMMNFIYTRMIGNFPLNELLKWILTTPVQFWIGWRFHAGAYRALRARRANMDVLVSLGTNASYLYSIISILHHHFKAHHMSGLYRPTDFFETSAMLITLVLFGKYLESAAKGKTSEAIVKLCQLAPPTALLVENDPSLDPENKQDHDKDTYQFDVLSSWHEREVSTELIHCNDILKIIPGSKIPVDGTVVAGSSYVDESMLTGESDPVQKSTGSSLYGGTMNTGGTLYIKAVRIGADTALSQIVRLVETAQLSKAPIQGFADRVSAVFVPIVVLISLVTWLAWFIAGSAGWYPSSWLPEGHSVFLFSLLFAIAVIVIACPCALGLATPTAVMVGTGVAATNGILIKGGESLERAVGIKTVVFDKTGTITAGKPRAVDFKMIAPGLQPGTVFAMAAALERNSEHPIAAAILELEKHYNVLERESHEKESCQSSLDDNNSNGNGSRSLPDSAAHSLSRIGRTLDANNKYPTAITSKEVSILVGEGIRGWLKIPKDHPNREVLLQFQHRREREYSPGSSPVTAPIVITKHAIGKFSLTSEATTSDECIEISMSIGNKRLMEEVGAFPMPSSSDHASVDAYIRKMESLGCTCVWIAIDASPVAVVAVMDPIKEESRGVIAALHSMGMTCALLTGDNWRTARAIASQLGISSVHAEVLPAGKVSLIKELQDGGRTAVAMVGDGVNDSPALAQADIGIAVGSGADVAIEAADFVLMKSDLEDVLMALDLCRTTYARIKWNYAWALGYNLTMIPVAAGCLYPGLKFQLPPWVAGACMALSSVSVVVSSLMLRNYRRPRAVLRDVALRK